jgi:hypothetical protein
MAKWDMTGDWLLAQSDGRTVKLRLVQHWFRRVQRPAGR